MAEIRHPIELGLLLCIGNNEDANSIMRSKIAFEKSVDRAIQRVLEMRFKRSSLGKQILKEIPENPGV